MAALISGISAHLLANLDFMTLGQDKARELEGQSNAGSVILSHVLAEYPPSKDILMAAGADYLTDFDGSSIVIDCWGNPIAFIRACDYQNTRMRIYEALPAFVWEASSPAEP